MGAATLAFRVLLRAYPGRFRSEFGPEMVDVFRLASLRTWREGGLGRLTRYWGTVLVDVVRTSRAERRRRAPDLPPPRKDRTRMFDQLGRDLRYALRSMRQRPLFAAAAVLSLGLGIGANVAIYGVLDAVLLRPTPLQDPSSLVAPGNSIVTYPAYRDFRDRAHSFSGLAAWDTMGRRLALQRGDTVESVPGVLVSGNYFDVLGIEPVLGRAITPADDAEPGASPVAVISYNLWRSRFAAAPDVVGSDIVVNGQTLTVIGVAPPGFRGERLNAVQEMWIPLAMSPVITPGGGPGLDDRDAWWIRMMGRLAPGASPQEALAELNAIGAQLATEYGRSDSEWQFDQIMPANAIASISSREDLLRFVWLLGATVGAALVIACANVSNLLLARGEQRRGEIAMRRALGATRGRVIRQFFAESVLVAVAGGAVGVLVAVWAFGLLRAFQLPGNIDIATLDLGIDASTLVAALALSLLTAAFFGTLPAVRFSDPGGHRRHERAGTWLRGSFVSLQVALSLVILLGGGLFARSLMNALSVDPGFDGDHLAIAEVDLGTADYDVDRADVYYRQAMDRLAALPGVEAVAWANAVPVESKGYVEDVAVEGFEPGPGEDRIQSIHMNLVSSGFFRTIGLPLVRGRDLDDRLGSREVVVNETLAERYWPGQDPLGKRLQLGSPTYYVVVGVAADSQIRHLGETPFPYIYAPLQYFGEVTRKRLVARLATPAEALGALVQQLSGLDNVVPVENVRTWADHMGQQTQLQQMGVNLLGFFSLVALTLAAVGIYGVVSYSVVRRTRELGVRMALGAQRGDVMRLMLRTGMLPIGIGALGGVAIALANQRLIAGFLFEVEPGDPAIMLWTVAVILVIGLIATIVPARRATRVDPLVALRGQ